MSANNWRECPQCRVNAEAARTLLNYKLDESYGKIPVADYLEMRDEATKPIELGETLREDYELFIAQTKRFYIGYTASCSVCGFNKEFKHEEILKLTPQPPREKKKT